MTSSVQHGSITLEGSAFIIPASPDVDPTPFIPLLMDERSCFSTYGSCSACDVMFHICNSNSSVLTFCHTYGIAEITF